ncbi:MAG: hypothetical protein ACK5LR_10710 [Mangrovibacterium sp.]
MEQHLLIFTSIAQWGIFIAICALIYSKVESKAMVKKLAQGLFVMLGIYALWILLAGVIEVPQVADGASAPKEAKILTFFAGLTLNGLLASVSLLLNLMGNNKAQRILNALLLLSALALFFMVYNLQKF